MGLFSSKKKTVVSASVGRMFQDEDIQPRIKRGVIDYVRAKSAYNSIGDMIVKEAPKRINKRAERIARRIENGAPYLPGVFRSSLIEEDLDPADTLINNLLVTQYGASVSKKYALLEETNLSHMSWLKLISQYGYNPRTNELEQVSLLRGRPCYLEDGQIYCCSATLQQAYDVADLSTIGLSYDHGVTETRVQDYTRVRKTWLEDTVSDKDLFKFSYIYVVVKTQTVVTQISDNTEVSNTTSFNGVAPLVWEAIVETIMSQTTTDDGTNSTVVTVTNMGYRIREVIDFLDYEISGEFDETNAITAADEFLLDPLLEDTSTVISNSNSEYFMVSFSYIESGLTYYGYFTYEIGSGTIPELDNILGLGVTEENYFPNIYFRRNGVALNRDVDKTTDMYKQSKRLCKRLDLDYNDLTNNLHENVGSLDKVKNMHMNFCIPVNESTPLHRKYLHLWAEKMFQLGDNISGTYPAAEVRTGQLISYYDNLFEHRVVFTNITKELVILNLGTVDTYYVDITTTTTLSLGAGSVYRIRRNSTYTHNFYKQVSATECIKFSLIGLTSIQIVQPGYEDTATNDAQHLVIPINLNLLKELSNKEAEKLMSQSLHIFVHTSEVIKTRWYQRGVFRVILTIIAVLLAIIPGGQPFSIALFAQVLVVNILVQFVLTTIIKFLVKEFNLKGWVATLIVVGALFLGGVYSFDLTAMLNVNVLMTSFNLGLQLTAYGATIEYQAYLEEFTSFMVDAEAKSKFLEEAQNMMRKDEVIFHPLFSPNTTISMYYNLGQTASEYYAKTSLAYSIPSIIYGQIAGYYDTLLDLPEPNYS